nr:hypothetical protein [Tanacetum cinerariifolium]
MATNRPPHVRTHTLIWRNKTDLEEQSLDDFFNSLKIYEAEDKSSTSTSTSTQNIAFVSSSNTDSTNEPVSAVASVSAVSVKIPVSALPNVDTLSNAVIYLFFARRNLGTNRLSSMGFDMSKVECYNCHRKGHFARKCRSPKDIRRNGVAEPQRKNGLVGTSTSNALVSQCDGVGSYDWSFQAEEEPTNYAIMAFTSSSSSSDNDKSVEARLLVYQQNESVFEEDIKLLKLEVQLRDNELVVLRQNLDKAEEERDDLKFKLEKFKTSSKNLNDLLASQTNAKTGSNQEMGIMMFLHNVPPPYIGTCMPPKPDLVFHNAPNDVETVHTAFNVKRSPTKPDNDLSHTHRPLAPIIEDWVSDSEDESETKIPQNVPSFVQPTKQIKSPRPSV